MRYVKIPTRAYKQKDLIKFKGIEDEEEAWKEALLETSDIRYVDTFVCIPLKILEGCTFEPISFITEEDESFESGKLHSTLITTSEGDNYSSTWDIKELTNSLIKWGIVDESFKKEI